MSFFETRLIGDLLQRIYDHRRVQNFLTAEMMAMVFSSIMLLVFSGVLAYYDLTVFWVFSAGSLLYAVWIFSFLHKRKILDYELFSLEAQNQSALHQFVTSTQEIKLQGCEERRCKEWRNTQDTLFDVQYKRLHLTQSQEAGSIVIYEMKNILITAITATSVVSGGISMGTMLAIQYIIGQLNVPIEQLMNFIYSAQDVNISLERINEIHESKEENFEHVGLKSLKGGQSIKLSNVCFKYNPHSKNEIIKNITTEIKQGEITAIVGASGSGKSTLIKLMLGFYSVGNGSIFIGNNTIDDYDLKWLRSRCGVVMQEGYIFSDTIARNIAMSEGKINLKKLDEAARIANIHDFIDNLPFRYDTKIGQDGLTLSKGQQQRILIARAVYKNPNYIFLDEATNALDAENENIIVKNLWRFYQGRTVVIVAHRLSTVKNADKIIVLDQGRIAETGTHQTLTANKGLYYNLVKNQLELDQ